MPTFDPGGRSEKKIITCKSVIILDPGKTNPENPRNTCV